MDKAELLLFLDKKKWGSTDRTRLVEVWNELRGDSLGKIGPNQVRSVCRLKQIRTSLIQFANSEMV